MLAGEVEEEEQLLLQIFCFDSKDARKLLDVHLMRSVVKDGMGRNRSKGIVEFVSMLRGR